MKSYSEKLLNPKWRYKRMKVLQRDKYKCTVCGSNKKLEVHHTYYRRHKAPWNYPLKSLITLCSDCHYKWHCEHETPVRGKQKSQGKPHKKISKPKIKKWIPRETDTPRYRKRVNGEWVIIDGLQG